MLKIQTLRLKNFFSYGDEHQVVFDNRTTPLLIYGENGAGKSTIFEAVIWGLFGETLKGVSADDVVNRENKYNCCVRVKGTINNDKFEITRYRKDEERSNYIDFRINDVVNVGETNSATQKIINEALNLDFESFLYTSYFNPSLSESFASLGDKKQKNIIEQLIKTDVWDLCNTRATGQLGILNQRRQVLITKRGSLLAKKEVSEKSVEDLLSLLAQSNMKGMKDNIDANHALINKHKIKLETKPNVIVNRDTTRNEYNGLFSSITATEKYLLLAEQGKCVNCSRDFILSDDDTDKLKHKLAYLKAAAQCSKKRYLRASDRLVELGELEIEVSKLCAEFESFEAMYDMASNTKAILDTTNKRIIEYISEIKKLTNSIETIEKEVIILESVKRLSGPRGARVYALNHLIPHLNRSLKHFCNELSGGEMGVTISFDTKTARCKVLCEFDHVMDYNSCSSGQARRVDLCIMLAFLDLLKYLGKNTNFLILDEFLDSLDKKGVEKTLEILYSLKYDNIFIISHNTELKDVFENKLLVAQDTKGFSRFAGQPK